MSTATATLLLFTSLLLLPAKPVAGDEQDVVVLTNNNFTDFVTRHHYVLLQFYAPWCNWSRSLAPEYEAAATMLKEQAVLAKIDAHDQHELACRFNVTWYPTMFLLVGGAQKIVYHNADGRDRDDIASWVRQKMGPLLQVVETTEEAERILTARSAIVVGFLDPFQGLQSEELSAVSKLHVDVNFYQTSTADVARLFHINPRIKPPSLRMLIRDDFAANHTPFAYAGPFTRSDISQYISLTMHLFLAYFPKKSQPVLNEWPDKPLAYFSKKSQAMPNEWLYKPFASIISNDRGWGPWLHRKLDEIFNSWWPLKNGKNVFNNMEDMLRSNKILDNTFKEDEKIIDKPVVDEKDVVILTQENFTDFISDRQYVMVNFYASWCEWCQKLAPEYEAAATMLKGQIVLAKVDAFVEAQLSREYNIQGYPTMYLLGDRGQKVAYHGERFRDAIATWVRWKIGIVVQTLMSTKEAEPILTDQTAWVLGILDTVEGPESVELAAASKLHSDVNFYQTTDDDVARLFGIDPEIKRPALVILKWEAADHTHTVFDGLFTRSAMDEFISVHKHPSLVTFIEENASSIFSNPMSKCFFFAPKDSWEVISTHIQRGGKPFLRKAPLCHCGE